MSIIFEQLVLNRVTMGVATLATSEGLFRFGAVFAADFATPNKLALALQMLCGADDVISPSAAHNVTSVWTGRGDVAASSGRAQGACQAVVLAKVGERLT